VRKIKQAIASAFKHTQIYRIVLNRIVSYLQENQQWVSVAVYSENYSFCSNLRRLPPDLEEQSAVLLECIWNW